MAKAARIGFPALLLGLLLLSATWRGAAGKPVDYFSRALDAMAGVDSYTATYLSKESEKAAEETVLFKFKKPFAVYMKWIRNPNKGREVLFVKGQNGNKIVAHDGGLFGVITVTMDPNSKQARGDSGDTILDAGIQRFIEQTLAEIRKAEGAGKYQAKELGAKSVLGRSTDQVEFQLPGAKGMKRMVVSFDRENHLPIQWETYNSDGRLVERYGYRDLKLNAGLTNADFDRHNKAYKFR